MRIRELSLRNYRVFEEVDLELPARVIGIFGPNGAGKSTLMEAVLYALYGRARTGKDQIRTHGLLTDCAVRLVFEHGGSQYEVRRTIRGRNHLTEAELFVGDLPLAAGVTEVDGEIHRLLRMDQQVFRASVFAEQKQLDAFSDVTKGKRKEMVLRLLGIRPVDDARTAARKEARDAKANADRLADALPDLSAQEAELERARAEEDRAGARAEAARRALEGAEERWKAADEAFGRSERVRERVEKIAVERRGVEESAAELDRRIEKLDRRLAELRRAVERLPALREEAAALAEAPKRLEEARRLAEYGRDRRERQAELERRPSVDAAAVLEELRAAAAAHEQAQAAAATARAQRAAAAHRVEVAREALARAAQADPSQPCPTCGRPLGDDFRRYLSHCEEEVAEAERRAAEEEGAAERAGAALSAAAKRLKGATDRGDAARRSDDERRRIHAELERLETRMAPLLDRFGGREPDLSALEDEARRADDLAKRVVALEEQGRHVATLEADLSTARTELAARRTRIEDLDRQAGSLAFDAEEHARLAKERQEAARGLDDARGEERAASDGHRSAAARVTELEAGIRKVKEIAARVEELREDARYVDRVSRLLDGFRDHLVSRIGPELSREAEALFRDLTNREYEDLRIDEDTLAIQIADGTDYFPVERFSGSEADLANLALRVAISMHLSRMSGADIGMMVLDEVLASLDAERKDLFVQTMGRLANRFNQLFVVTHAEQVKDQFPAAIEVRKVGRRRSEAALV